MSRKTDRRKIIKRTVDGKRTDRVKKAERERMLRLRNQGKTMEEIALELDRSERTVSKQLQKAQTEKEQTDGSSQASQKEIDPLVLEAQKEHLDEIRKIILDFKKLFCEEDYIVSSIEITLSLGELWRNPLFRSLREHIPNQAFWSQYSECQTRLLDYTSNRNTLEAEIRDSLDQWPGIQRLGKYCQVPIIINIIHKAFGNDLVRLTGERDYRDVFTYECGGAKWKSLLARNLVDKREYEILIAEKPTDYIPKYVALSNNLLNSEKAKALGTSYVGLSTLLDSISRVLSQTLTNREYILHTCQLCPEIVKQKQRL